MKKYLSFKEAWKALSIKWQSIFATIVLVWMVTPDDKQAQVLALLPIADGQPGWLVLAGIGITVWSRMKLQSDPPQPVALPPAPPAPPIEPML